MMKSTVVIYTLLIITLILSGCSSSLKNTEYELEDTSIPGGYEYEEEQPPSPMPWTRQFGTDSDDGASAIAIDATGVYVAGGTYGTLSGQSSTGEGDAFVRKYDADGNEMWTRQFGTDYYDWASAIAIDATGVYVAGSTYGNFPGQSRAGEGDAFVRKYDATGNELWTRQFGTDSYDSSFAIAIDVTGVYVVGRTYGTFPEQSSAGLFDAFVRKYDVDGNELWTRQFGTDIGEDAVAVATDATGLYVAGYTGGTFPGQESAGWADSFVRKYDAYGNEMWTRQFGTNRHDMLTGISIDSTGVYVAGPTEGIFPGQSSAGNWYAFVRKYNADGNEIWTRQFERDSYELASFVAIDATGVYVAGRTFGISPGQSSAISRHDFVRKYDADGNEIWTRQFGTESFDQAYSIAIDATGVYVAGGTEGTFPGQSSAGGKDAFIIKLLK